MTTRTPSGAKNCHSGRTSCKEGKGDSLSKQQFEIKGKGMVIWSNSLQKRQRGRSSSPTVLFAFFCKQTYEHSEEG